MVGRTLAWTRTADRRMHCSMRHRRPSVHLRDALVQHRERARDTSVVGLQRLLDAARDGRQGGLVKHAVHSGHGAGHCVRIRDIAFDQLDSIRDNFQVSAKPRAQVIQDPHLVAAGNQGLCQVRADEARAASYKKAPHQWYPRPQVRRLTAGVSRGSW